MKLLLIKEYNPLIIIDHQYLLAKENYLPAIEYQVKEIGELYNASQEDPNHRSASVGDIIQLGTRMFMICIIGYREVRWGQLIDFTISNND